MATSPHPGRKKVVKGVKIDLTDNVFHDSPVRMEFHHQTQAQSPAA